MGQHLPSTVWALRSDAKTYVRTNSPDSLFISVFENSGQAGFIISRRDARLLAKRINQCLDATTNRGIA
jgi:hypothetical protein